MSDAVVRRVGEADRPVRTVRVRDGVEGSLTIPIRTIEELPPDNQGVVLVRLLATDAQKRNVLMLVVSEAEAKAFAHGDVLTIRFSRPPEREAEEDAPDGNP